MDSKLPPNDEQKSSGSESWEVLVTRTLAGDDAASERLLVSLTHLLDRWLTHLCRNAEHAHDLRQEILMEIVRKNGAWLRSWDPAKGRRFTSYLWILTVRRFCAWRKGRHARLSYDFEDLSAASGVVCSRSNQDREHLVSEVRRYLQKLRPNYQEVLRLFYEEGVPQRELAALYGVTVNAIATWLFRGRAELRAMLE